MMEQPTRTSPRPTAGRRRGPVHHLVGLLLGLVALASTLGCAGGPPPPSAPSPLLGGRLPEFRRRAVDGTTIDTAALGGKVVVVKFFAKYCEPCKKTLPAAERIHQDRPEVVVIGVAEDEYRADVDTMIETYRLTFPVIHDRGNVLSGRFRVSEMPIAFVADGTGTIRWVAAERHSEADLQRAVAAAGAP